MTEDYAAGMVEDTGLTHAQLLDITINYNATMRASLLILYHLEDAALN